jgi:probable F420-dependent oxidoreductase
VEFWQAISYAPLDQLVGIARCAEECGFAGLAIPDHLVTPLRVESRYPYATDGEIFWDPAAPYPEPWITAAVLARETRRLRFMTYVYVLPLRDPFSAAKSISTAALWSDNRLVVGAGSGWMEEEFRIVGRSFGDRGRRMDEMLAVLRKLLAGGPVEHHSQLFDFAPLQLAPVPAVRVPIWIGGHSDAALRRAAGVEGWVGVNYDEGQIGPILRRLERFRSRIEPAAARFSVTVALNEPVTPQLCGRLAELGVTGIVVPAWLARGEEPSSLGHKQTSLRRFGEEVIARVAPARLSAG